MKISRKWWNQRKRVSARPGPVDFDHNTISRALFDKRTSRRSTLGVLPYLGG
jgi:hypothetical protein